MIDSLVCHITSYFPKKKGLPKKHLDPVLLYRFRDGLQEIKPFLQRDTLKTSDLQNRKITNHFVLSIYVIERNV